jgi:hypothetical protein
LSKEIYLELMCELTEDELHIRAQQLAAAIGEQDRVKGEKADAMKDYTDQLKEIEERLRIISRAIRSRQEFRMVKCQMLFHSPSPGFKRTVREDTGELVSEEAMTAEERQRHLFEPQIEEEK